MRINKIDKEAKIAAIKTSLTQIEYIFLLRAIGMREIYDHLNNLWATDRKYWTDELEIIDQLYIPLFDRIRDYQVHKENLEELEAKKQKLMTSEPHLLKIDKKFKKSN